MDGERPDNVVTLSIPDMKCRVLARVIEGSSINFDSLNRSHAAIRTLEYLHRLSCPLKSEDII